MDICIMLWEEGGERIFINDPKGIFFAANFSPKKQINFKKGEYLREGDQSEHFFWASMVGVPKTPPKTCKISCFHLNVLKRPVGYDNKYYIQYTCI